MPAPQYLQPLYVTYDMIKGYLGTINVSMTPLINLQPELGQSEGIYIEDLNTLLALAESDVIINVFSNYLAIPLESRLNVPFNDFYDIPNLRNTYIFIRNIFINCSLWYIYKTYYAQGGNANGQALTKNALDKYNQDKVSLVKLDTATNPVLKNVFQNMKLATNYTPRIPKAPMVPDIPTGEPQTEFAYNSIPDFAWGFNR